MVHPTLPPCDLGPQAVSPGPSGPRPSGLRPFPLEEVLRYRRELLIKVESKCATAAAALETAEKKLQTVSRRRKSILHRLAQLDSAARARAWTVRLREQALDLWLQMLALHPRVARCRQMAETIEQRCHTARRDVESLVRVRQARFSGHPPVNAG